MGEIAVLEGEGSATADSLTAEEILATFEALSPDDKMKLIAIERKLIGGTGRQKGELYREALCRALLGKRRCARSVPVIAFFAETMRSIASHDRDRQRRYIPLDLDDLERAGTARLSPNLLSNQPDPEEQLLATAETEPADTIATIQGHFDGDEQCQMTLLGWADGLRGKELREFIGVDQAQLDYLGKKIRRKMEKLYPNGWRQ